MMIKSQIRKVVYLSSLLATSALSLAAQEAKLNDVLKHKNPNYVFILVDDMGWTGMSVKAYDKMDNSKSDYFKTPNLEKLAKQGICFSNAYAPASLCTPSRASILTGKTPAALRMTTPGPVQNASSSKKLVPPKHVTDLPEKEITIAEILKTKSYATAHFGKWHLKGGGPGKHGFDQHDGDTGNTVPRNDNDSNPKDIFGITKRGQEFMTNQVKNGRPFYLQLSHYAVHSPVETLNSSKDEFNKLTKGTRHNSAEYAGMTKDFDTSVGQIMNTIKDLKIENSTYIIFMSDNGAGLRGRRNANKPLTGGKGSLNEGGIRVPMIVSGPGIKEKYCHQNVVGYDIFPTICELSEIKNLPDSIEGTSLVPLLNSNIEFKRKYKELIFHFPHYGQGPSQVPQSAIIVDSMKLIVNYDKNTISMYNLESDIEEKHNIYKEPLENFPASEGVTKYIKSENPSTTLLDRMNLYLKRVKAQFATTNKSYDVSASESNSLSTMFLDRNDSNKDGKVSKDEFKGPARRFSHLDKNNDGYITIDEAPTNIRSHEK